MRMIYGPRSLKHGAAPVRRTKGAAMYELLGALAFATLVASYVLAVVFVRHEDDDSIGHPSARHEGNKNSAAAGRRVSGAATPAP
jgi:hypothetical protein